MAFIQKESHQVNWRLLEFVNKTLWRIRFSLHLYVVGHGSNISCNCEFYGLSVQKESHQVNWRLLEFVNKTLWRFSLNLLLVTVQT